MHFERFLEGVSHSVATALELIAVLVIAAGALHALGGIFGSLRAGALSLPRRRAVWLGFGTWLLLGLEFELAADIVRTTSSPTWTDLGWLGAVAVIRTFLSFFLERDLAKVRDAVSRPAV